MILERLGFISDEISSNFIDALNWIQAKGLKHVEVRTVNGTNIVNLTDVEVEQITKEIKQRGLSVSGIASPVFKCALDPARLIATGDTFSQQEADIDTHFNQLFRTIEIAKMMGTFRIRIFSFWRESEPELHRDEVVRNLRKAANIAEKEKMILLLENEPSCNGGYAEEVGKLIKGVNSHALRALWDPGNEEYGGRPSFPEGYQAIRDVLGHVHLKDARINENGNSVCVPIGDGRVPFIDQFRKLEQDGYTGLFIMEPHYIPEGGNSMDGSEKSLNGLFQLLQSAGMSK
jgi:L-ribulose-5-phosphate 3-epimerase